MNKSEDYLKQIDSEYRTKKIIRGYGNKSSPNNHYLYCEIMNYAGALMLKVWGIIYKNKLLKKNNVLIEFPHEIF